MVPDEVVAAEGFFKCRSITKLFLILKVYTSSIELDYYWLSSIS